MTVKKPKQRSFLLITVAIAIILGLVYIVQVPIFPNWTGLNGKTAWDMVELLVVPVVLSLIAYFLNRQQKVFEQKIAEDQRKIEQEIAQNQRISEQEIANNRNQEIELQSYYDRMTHLLLDKNLLRGGIDVGNTEARIVAKARTITALRNIDAARKALVLQFLFEAKLINKAERIIDLSDFDIGNIRFFRMRMHEVSLQRVAMPSAQFSRCVFQYVDFSQADLRDTRFEGSAFLDCDFGRANLTNSIAVTFHGVESSFIGSKLSGIDFTGANLLRCKFDDADVRDSILSNASCFEASLQGANLSRTHLIGANLQNADFTSANLQDAKLASVVATGAKFDRAFLQKADLEGANLQAASLEGADLRGAKLIKANLSEANLNRVNLGGANLEGADLRNTRLDNILYDDSTIWPNGFAPPPI